MHVCVIKDAGLPLVQEAADAIDPERPRMHCGAGLRASTLKPRLKVWHCAELWLYACYLVCWPARAT